MLADCLIHNTSEVLTCAGAAPKCGRQQADVAAQAHAVISSRNGVIAFVGSAADWSRHGTLTPDATVIDAGGGAVGPGFVDPHTPVGFAGDRRRSS